MAYKYQTFLSPSDAARAIQDFLYDRDAPLPERVRNRLRELVSPAHSTVDAVVQGAELLYSVRNELAPEALALGAGLALLADQQRFSGMDMDNRGSRMALGMMRDANIPTPIGVNYPNAESDPAVRHDAPGYVGIPSTPPVPTSDAFVTNTGLTPPVIEGSRRGVVTRNPDETNTS